MQSQKQHQQRWSYAQMALCSKPYVTLDRQPVPCGQCMGCLTNRKRLWTHRIILESYAHDKNSFVTLTYDPENLPLNSQGTPTLRKKDLSNFLKRLRGKLPEKIRYYAVGEYGTNGARGINPHFHLCLFNVGEGHHQQIDRAWQSSEGYGKQGHSLGFTYTGSLTPQSAAYVAGYVQKKNKYNQDMYYELDIIPEYSVMSQGIGKAVVPYLAETLRRHPEGLTPSGDVPYSIQHGDRKLPLGNYLREKLREELNLDHTEESWMDPITGEITTKRKWHGKELQKEVLKMELQELQENKAEDQKFPQDASVSITQALDYKNAQGIRNFENKQKIYTIKQTL